MHVFKAACQAAGIGTPVAEYRFSPPRKWRFDWAWPGYRVALEVEGGAYHGHGHRSVGRFLRDIEKYNEAAVLGWRVLRCTVQQFERGDVIELIQRAVEESKP